MNLSLPSLREHATSWGITAVAIVLAVLYPWYVESLQELPTVGTFVPALTAGAIDTGCSAPAPQRSAPFAVNDTPCTPACAGWHVAHVSSPFCASARWAGRVEAWLAP